MRAPPYRGPLPAPLAAARRRVLLAAWLGRTTPTTIEVDGFSLLFEPGLPDPRPALGFSTARFLLDALDLRPEERVLDIGCGAGWISLAAARAGASVVSLDPSPNAAHCLRRSSLVAGLGEPDIRTGDGIEPLHPDETFDLVTWIPPSLEGPAGTSDRADRLVLADRSRITGVLKGVLPRLERGGRLMFPFPDRDATPWLHDAMASIGYRFTPVAYEKPRVLGPVRVYKAWPARHGAAGEVPPGDALPGAAWVLKDR
ncbi:MAG: methyltransferase [Deltaproteobacteria bacterium]|nr:methyltransferase [Deltaproteobacteria bacterium]